MKQIVLRKITYITAVSLITTWFILSLVLYVKDMSCEGVRSAIAEFEVFGGTCAADSNGYLPLAIGIYVVSVLFFTLNLWVIKRLKL